MQGISHRDLTTKEFLLFASSSAFLATALTTNGIFTLYYQAGGCEWSGFAKNEDFSCYLSWVSRFAPYIGGVSTLWSIYTTARLRLRIV